MKNLHHPSSSSLSQQKGFIFRLLHSLLIVAIVVSLVVLYKMGKLQHFREWSQDTKVWLQEQSESFRFATNTQDDEPHARHAATRDADEDSHKVTRPKEDTQYTETGRFAVQVAAGYDSRQLYAWRDALQHDGFDAYLVSLNTAQGLLLKLRVGSYKNRHQADKLRERLRNRYPEQGLFEDSFVVEGD